MFSMLVFVNLMPVIIILIILVTIIKGIAEWNKNNKSPRLTVDASIVSKRTTVTNHTHANAGDVTGMHGYNTTSSTNYHVTFQVESGDTMEFNVEETQYGMMAEGDYGKLNFQGSRFLGFIR
ncbi:MAG: DUF2500 domain-containing protein [Clostridium sp.]|nr:DUF2500 domain-containing protein [Clostridium sp.]